MNATDIRNGDQTVNYIVTTTETAEAPTVPAAFLPTAPGAPCEHHMWCVETGSHIDHFSRRVSLTTSDKAEVLTAHFYTDEPTGTPCLDYDCGFDDWREFTSGDELRAEVAQVRTHLVRLEALADECDAVREAAGQASVNDAKSRAGTDDAEQQVAIETARRWTITTTNGFTAYGYLPAWAEENPSAVVPANRLQLRIADVCHSWWFDGQPVTTDTPDEGDRRIGPDALLRGLMVCRPYSDNPVERVPHVDIEVLEGSDEWIEHLDPAGVADLAGKLRAQADRLDEVGRKLTQARADWAANGGSQR